MTDRVSEYCPCIYLIIIIIIIDYFSSTHHMCKSMSGLWTIYDLITLNWLTPALSSYHSLYQSVSIFTYAQKVERKLGKYNNNKIILNLSLQESSNTTPINLIKVILWELSMLDFSISQNTKTFSVIFEKESRCWVVYFLDSLHLKKIWKSY